MKAVYITVTQGMHDALWYWHLLSNFSYPMHDPTIIYIDNQLAIAIAQNKRFSEQTKHIEVGHHFIHEKLEDGSITLEYILTDCQLADILTKPLPKDQFHTLAQLMGLNGTHLS
jgi:hypothetical protein